MRQATAAKYRIEPGTRGASTTTVTAAPEAATTTATPLPVVLRPGTAADHAFLFSSWLSSYQRSSFARPIRTRVFFARHHGAIERILERPRTVVTIAAWADDPSTVLGWAVTEGDVLHYVYVKDAFRRYGIAKRLCAGLPASATYTHKTNMVECILRRRPDANYDPYLL